MFDIGELIIYGNNGVCRVTEITEMSVRGINDGRLYYVLQPYYQKTGKIFTPVDNEKVTMRQLISKEEANALIEDIPNIELLWITNDKQREEIYKKCIRSHECKEYVKIIKTLYLRKQERIAQGKKITATDERYFKQAEDNLYEELSIPLGMPKEEIASYIAKRIEQLQNANAAE